MTSKYEQDAETGHMMTTLPTREFEQMEFDLAARELLNKELRAENERLKDELADYRDRVRLDVGYEAYVEGEVVDLRAEHERLTQVIERCDKEMDALNSALVERDAENERLRAREDEWRAWMGKALDAWSAEVNRLLDRDKAG